MCVRRPARGAADDARDAARRLRPRRGQLAASATSTWSYPRPSCAETLARLLGCWPAARVESRGGAAGADDAERRAPRARRAAPPRPRRRTGAATMSRVRAELRGAAAPHRRARRRVRDLGCRRSSRATTSGRTRSTTSSACSTDFTELHGDRACGDDPAIVAGLGRFRGRTVALVGHQKGRDLKRADVPQLRHGAARGLRARRSACSTLGDRLGFPVLTFIDTPGAYPGVGAEQRGQAGTIARSMLAMTRLVGAVGGGRDRRGRLRRRARDRRRGPRADAGARDLLGDLARGLRRDPVEGRRSAPKAAAAFKPTARFCLELGVIDGIVPEPSGGAHRDHDEPRGCSATRSRTRSRRRGRAAGAAARAGAARASARWASGSSRPGRRARRRVDRRRRWSRSSSASRRRLLHPHARREDGVDHEQGRAASTGSISPSWTIIQRTISDSTSESAISGRTAG